MPPVLCASALIAVHATAWAQQNAQGFDAHGFHLAAHDADLRDGLVVQRPGPFSQGDLFLGGLTEYASAPLVLVAEAEFSDQVVETAVLDHLVGLNLSGGVAAHDRLRFDVKMPVYLVTTDQRLGVSQPPAPGDLRVSAMVVGVRPDHVAGGGGFGLALVGHVDVPAGPPDRFLGQDGVAGGGKVAATYEFRTATLSADLGTQFNPALDLSNLNNSDTMIAGLQLGALASDAVGLSWEVVAAPPFEPPTRLSFPAEALMSMRYKDRTTGSFWTLGGAVGLTSGPGVAAFRVFMGGGVARQEDPRQPDFDAIGVFKVRDLCPTEYEVRNGWRDDDGCPDDLSALAVEVRAAPRITPTRRATRKTTIRNGTRIRVKPRPNAPRTLQPASKRFQKRCKTQHPALCAPRSVSKCFVAF